MMWGYDRRRGFTLVELLTVIAVIAILGAILIPVVGDMVRKGQQAAGQSLMRGIGGAINLYAAEHDGYLPGPMWPGQVAELDPTRGGRLVRDIEPYMDYAEPASTMVVDDFAPPAFWDEVASGNEASTRVYVLNEVITVDEADYRPFGAQAAANNGEAVETMKHNQIARLFPKEWLLSDCDRQHPSVQGKGWAGNTLPEPFHGDTRNTLYFDGRVDVVAVE